MKKLKWAIPFIILLLLPLVIDWVQNEEIEYNNYKISGKIVDEQAIKAPLDVIFLNNEAVNQKDIDLYLSTLNEDSREVTKTELEEFFKTYDIKHEINALFVQKQTDDRVVIEVVKTARNQNEEEFQDHQSSNVITLEKSDGEWFIVEALVNKTQLL